MPPAWMCLPRSNGEGCARRHVDARHRPVDGAVLEPEDAHGLLDREVRMLGRVDDTVGPQRTGGSKRGDPCRSRPCPRCARATRAAGRGAARASRARPARARSRPVTSTRPSRSTLSAAISNSARIPGSEPVIPKYAKNRGWFQCVSAGRIISSRSEARRERLARLRRRLGQRARSRRARPAASTGRSPTVRGTTPTHSKPASLRRATGRHRFFRSFSQLLPRARVDDVGLREPRPPRLADAELHVVERPDLVAVGVDDELQARLACGAGGRREVEPVGLRVDLEERPVSSAFSITRSRSTSRGRAADLPVREVPDAST